MATGEPFGYGLISGLTYGGAAAQNAFNQLAQSGSLASAASGAVTITTNPYLGLNQWFVTSGTMDMSINATSAQPENEKPKAPRWKSAKRMVDRLRMEIEDWHGDILERCPA